MSSAGRGFGVMKGRRHTSRQQPNGAKWVQVTKNNQVNSVVSLGGPLPSQREKVERNFTTYCSLSLGHPRNNTPKKVDLLRHLLGLIKEADETAAIQPYLPSDKVNSICHPAHILDKISDFEHYFPEVKYFHRRIRTKCRISTSIPIQGIKQKIFDKLRAHDFWIEPTSIKCQETTRCGFFLYAHPDFTYRNDIIEVLTPILKSKIQHAIDLEFDIQPEKLNVAVGSKKIGERVVMLRSTPTHSERVQNVLTHLFTEDDSTDIHTLRKYIFVPLTIVGDDDRSTLQGLLRTQQMFRQNVQHYIINNIWNLDKQFQVPAQEILEEVTLTDAQSNDTNSTNNEQAVDQDTHKTVTQEDTMMDTDMETSETLHDEEDNDTSNDTPPTEPYSLREWFYDLSDVDTEPLIHSIYPSTDDNKVYLLCEKRRAVKVLQILHNLVEIASIDFPDDAMIVYFGTNKKNPSVHNYPRATPQSTAYSNHLASFATAGNPQDEPSQPTSQPPREVPRNAKRTRDGAPLQGITNQNQTYSSATSTSIAEPDGMTYGTDMNDILSRLHANLNNLDQVGQKQEIQDQAMKQVYDRFQKVEKGLTTHGTVLNNLALTQEKQGNLMNSLNTKMDNLTEIITGTKPQDQIAQDLSHTTAASNPSHDAPEGMES